MAGEKFTKYDLGNLKKGQAVVVTLQGNATLGAERSSLKKLIDSINDISEDKYQEEDLIGRVHEYFLQIFAVGSSKEDGEFYTPACVVKLIAELIEPYSGVVYESTLQRLIQFNDFPRLAA